jgi:hypothetical protein
MKICKNEMNLRPYTKFYFRFFFFKSLFSGLLFFDFNADIARRVWDKIGTKIDTGYLLVAKEGVSTRAKFWWRTPTRMSGDITRAIKSKPWSISSTPKVQYV